MQPVQDELGSLELFTLHDKRMPRVVFENCVIELRDERLARPVPELKDRRDRPLRAGDRQENYRLHALTSHRISSGRHCD